MITHRLSTVTECDQILVLKQGQIVERGTHFDLLRARGKYWDMWETQTKARNQLGVGNDLHS